MDLVKKCLCGKETTIVVNADAYESYKQGKKVQDAFPDLNVFERECIISGTCFDCQSELFNQPKPGEDWGDQLFDCMNCGLPIYSKNMFTAVDFRCPCCGEKGVLPSA